VTYEKTRIRDRIASGLETMGATPEQVDAAAAYLFNLESDARFRVVEAQKALNLAQDGARAVHLLISAAAGDGATKRTTDALLAQAGLASAARTRLAEERTLTVVPAADVQPCFRARPASNPSTLEYHTTHSWATGDGRSALCWGTKTGTWEGRKITAPVRPCGTDYRHHDSHVWGQDDTMAWCLGEESTKVDGIKL